MVLYKLFFKASAEKELRRIPKPYLSPILQKIDALARIPRPYGTQMLRGETAISVSGRGTTESSMKSRIRKGPSSSSRSDTAVMFMNNGKKQAP